jgi:hypothetical protein
MRISCIKQITGLGLTVSFALSGSLMGAQYWTYVGTYTGQKSKGI